MRQLKGVKSIFESVLNVFLMLRRKIHLSIQRHKNRQIVLFPSHKTYIAPHGASVEENIINSRYYRNSNGMTIKKTCSFSPISSDKTKKTGHLQYLAFFKISMEIPILSCCFVFFCNSR